MLSRILKDFLPVDVTKIRNRNFIAKQIQFELDKIANVKRCHGWKDVSCCPLCGSSKREDELIIHEIPMVRCTSCELRYCIKIPADQNDIYQATDYKVYLSGNFEEDFAYRRERFGKERIKLLNKYCGDLTGKRLLDVGCGNGYFLSVAKDVCDYCVGSEFSEHLRKFAQERTGLRIYNHSLEKFPESNFDIITAFDVIEHIQDPVSFVNEAVNLLSPHGYFVIYTPNFDSFSVKVMRESSSIIDGSEHVILFSHRALNKLGEICNLKVIHTETRGLDINSIMAFNLYKGKEEENIFLAQWVN